MNEQNSTIPIWDGDPWHWRIPTNTSHQTERLRTRWHSPQTIHHRPRKASCWTSIHTTQALSKELWSPMSSNVPSSAHQQSTDMKPFRPHKRNSNATSHCLRSAVPAPWHLTSSHRRSDGDLVTPATSDLTGWATWNGLPSELTFIKSFKKPSSPVPSPHVQTRINLSFHTSFSLLTELFTGSFLPITQQYTHTSHTTIKFSPTKPLDHS